MAQDQPPSRRAEQRRAELLQALDIEFARFVNAGQVPGGDPIEMRQAVAVANLLQGRVGQAQDVACDDIADVRELQMPTVLDDVEQLLAHLVGRDPLAMVGRVEAGLFERSAKVGSDLAGESRGQLLGEALQGDREPLDLAGRPLDLLEPARCDRQCSQRLESGLKGQDLSQALLSAARCPVKGTQSVVGGAALEQNSFQVAQDQIRRASRAGAHDLLAQERSQSRQLACRVRAQLRVRGDQIRQGALRRNSTLREDRADRVARIQTGLAHGDEASPGQGQVDECGGIMVVELGALRLTHGIGEQGQMQIQPDPAGSRLGAFATQTPRDGEQCIQQWRDRGDRDVPETRFPVPSGQLRGFAQHRETACLDLVDRGRDRRIRDVLRCGLVRDERRFVVLPGGDRAREIRIRFPVGQAGREKGQILGHAAAVIRAGMLQQARQPPALQRSGQIESALDEPQIERVPVPDCRKEETACARRKIAQSGDQGDEAATNEGVADARGDDPVARHDVAHLGQSERADPAGQSDRAERIPIEIVVARDLPGARDLGLETPSPVVAQQSREADTVESLLGRDRQKDHVVGQIEPLDDGECLRILRLQAGEKGRGGHQVIGELRDRDVARLCRQMVDDQALDGPWMEQEDAFGRFEDAPAEELRGGLGAGGGSEVRHGARDAGAKGSAWSGGRRVVGPGRTPHPIVIPLVLIRKPIGLRPRAAIASSRLGAARPIRPWPGSVHRSPGCRFLLRSWR